MNDFGKRLSQIIDSQYDGDRKKFSELTGIPYSTITEYINGRKKDPRLSLISKIPNVNASWLISGDSDSNMVSEPEGIYTKAQKVPLYDFEATAGVVSIFDDLLKQEPVDQISIPDMPTCDGAVYIRGDSMYPILKSGDIVAYKILHDKRNSFIWGEMYLLSLNIEGDIMFTAKYVQKSDDKQKIKLVSHNQNHQDFEVLIDNVISFAIIKLSIRKHTI